MARDSHIPLFLWIATAILAHLMWGGGAHQVSRIIEERLDIQRFAAAVEQHVRRKGQAVEVSLLETPDLPRPPEDEEDTSAPDSKPDPADPTDETKQPERKKAAAEREQKPEPQKPEPVVEKKKAEEKPVKAPEELPKIVAPNRVAVQQHVEDKNQEDNPNAEFIADEANKVAEQTQARITSTDQNDKDPTPAATHASPEKAPGNSDESRVAQSEDRPGEPDRAPNEGATSRDKAVSKTPPANNSAAGRTAENTAAAREQGGGQQSKDTSPKSKQTPDPGQQQQAALKPQDSSPDTLRSESGSSAIAEASPDVRGRKAQRAKKKRLPPARHNRGPLDLLGLGATGTTAGGVNLNLTPSMAYAAVGQDRLTKERKADAERRKSAHRGSWRAGGIERWRSAIENYVSSVKPGNQTALNTARVPFASYLNQIHNRLHPIFADSFLASLDHLPGSHAMNRPDISTNLEIVLDQEEGRVVRMGVTKTSGVTAFDIAALEAVQRAQPFGMPPRQIVSPDGNVYFHWEFYRDPFYACSTYFAKPYMLKVKPKTAPPDLPPAKPRPFDPSESPAGDQRHGRLGLLEKQPALR
jgi:TonB family protein